MRRLCSISCKTLLCAVWLVPLVSWAAENKIEVSKPETPSTSAKTKPTIEITLMPSRQQAVAGSDFGITVRIENTSDQTIYFTPKSFLMVVPPELAPEGPIWSASFPVPPNPSLDPPTINWSQYSTELVALPPGADTAALFRLSEYTTGAGDRAKRWINDFSHGLSFPPGKYTLTVVGQYWDTPVINPSTWHTQSKDIQEDITAPQSIIVFGAILGGVFAFLLVWRDARVAADTHWAWGLVSAVLLSIIVTILLSRLSESQFLIRVTVSDLWGAMAVGFIGAASGPAVLQKFIGAVRPQTPPQTPPPKPQTNEEQQQQATEQQDNVEPAVALKETGLEPLVSGTSSGDGAKAAKTP